MKNPKTLQEVVTSGLCTGCGICASLAGNQEISMAISEQGFARPRFAEGSRAGESASLLAVCPGATVRGPERSESIDKHPTWGPILELHRTWSTDPDVRHRAAAGGTLTAMARYLLDSHEVDAVLHVRVNEADPLITDAVISRTADEALSGARSRYSPAAPLVHVRRLLDDGERFAVVAKPCDVAAIRNLARMDERVAKQVPYLLTIFCGGVQSVRSAEKIAAHHGVARTDLSEFHWRGEGWPGPTRVVNTAGDVFDMSYDETWFVPKPWTQPINMQWRCKVCPDAIGELSDISAPDAWIMKDGKPLHEEADGRNVAVVRTVAGQTLLRRAVEAGYLTISPMSVEELDVMHADHLPRKLGHPARIMGMAAAGEPVPDVEGYRWLAMVRRAGLGPTVRAFLGTVRRVRQGRNREYLETG